MVVKLVVLKGKAKGREIPLPSTQFVIGRGSSCHLQPHSGLVSKMHCAIARQPGGMVVVRDLKSRNHTFINNQPVKGTARVTDGDVLAVGPLLFQFAISSDDYGSPIQSVRGENLRWLLEENSDSNHVDSDAETAVIEIPPHLLEENGNSSGVEVNNSLTVGKYLREYFQTRKNGETAARKQVATVALHKEQLQFVDSLLNRLGQKSSSISRDEIVRILIDAISDKGLDISEIETAEDLKRILEKKIQ